jgi:hypothetical protein
VPSPSADDIAELCRDLGVTLPGGEGGSGSTTGETTGTAASALGGLPAPPEPSPLIPGSPTARWSPLVLAPIPGLSTLVGIVKPPLTVIKALLTVIAAFADILAAILTSGLDPYRALILAAYQLIKNLLEDLVNAGGYLYFDAPGITSPPASLAELGIPVQPAADFRHGREGLPPPAIVDAYVKWGERFSRSFDDPGDRQRPILSNGASVMAIFIVAAAPSMAGLRQLLYLLGKLFNITPFIKAIEDFHPASPDPDLTQVRTDSVAPDWKAARLKDLWPDIEKLLAIPDALRALLLNVDKVAGMLAALANALKDKAQTLSDMANAVQAIIDLLDALSAAGLYVLPVMSSQGPEGLRKGFQNALDRPPGGYIGGVCLLAAGPGMSNATVLFNLLAQGGAVAQLEGAWSQTKALARDEAAQNELGARLDKLGGSLERLPHQVAKAVNDAPEAFAEDLKRPVEEVVDLAEKTPAALADLAAEAKGRLYDDAVARANLWIADSRQRGPRSLAMGLGANPDQPAPPRDTSTDVLPRRSGEDDH